jgi:hypothetical protein
MMKIPDTIFKLSNEDYHRGEVYKEYTSSTQLKDYIISPKFSNYKKLHPEEFEISKDATEKGTLYHNCLESIVNTGSIDGFLNSVFLFEPPVNNSTGRPYGYDTKIYQECLNKAIDENPDKQIVSESDVNLVKSMVSELLNNCRQTSSDIKQIIRWGKAEVSHFIEYEGCRFKYRPDVETGKKILDWKSVSADDLHEDTISKLIVKFKYDISAAFYQFMEHERSGFWKDFFWVFQQKTAPFDAVLVSAENWCYSEHDGIIKMGAGALKFKNLLDQHIFCTQNNDFDGAQVFIQPGFKNRRIMTPSAPAYEQNRLLTFYN